MGGTAGRGQSGSPGARGAAGAGRGGSGGKPGRGRGETPCLCIYLFVSVGNDVKFSGSGGFRRRSPRSRVSAGGGCCVGPCGVCGSRPAAPRVVFGGCAEQRGQRRRRAGGVSGGEAALVSAKPRPPSEPRLPCPGRAASPASPREKARSGAGGGRQLFVCAGAEAAAGAPAPLPAAAPGRRGWGCWGRAGSPAGVRSTGDDPSCGIPGRVFELLTGKYVPRSYGSAGSIGKMGAEL